ncbi:unnamed protein product [Pieris macdunnoughi]|uniref:Uncharacterized protein n=1 Tax=Pieris macdunnoughi TaxID=345717 RepID=A0A821URY8_9NEOP|nr:unnamed protein product [Pieris macdunnoughi]
MLYYKTKPRNHYQNMDIYPYTGVTLKKPYLLPFPSYSRFFDETIPVDFSLQLLGRFQFLKWFLVELDESYRMMCRTSSLSHGNTDHVPRGFAVSSLLLFGSWPEKSVRPLKRRVFLCSI